MTAYQQFQTNLKAVFDAVPKAKFRLVFAQAQTLEHSVNRMATVLNVLREYFLDQPGGEDSPFVKQIDALVARRPKLEESDEPERPAGR